MGMQHNNISQYSRLSISLNNLHKITRHWLKANSICKSIQVNEQTKGHWYLQPALNTWTAKPLALTILAGTMRKVKAITKYFTNCVIRLTGRGHLKPPHRHTAQTSLPSGKPHATSHGMISKIQISIPNQPRYQTQFTSPSILAPANSPTAAGNGEGPLPRPAHSAATSLSKRGVQTQQQVKVEESGGELGRWAPPRAPPPPPANHQRSPK